MKGVTSMPFWDTAVGATITVQAIAAHKRFVFIFNHTLILDTRWLCLRFQETVSCYRPRNPVRVINKRVRCSENPKRVLKSRLLFWRLLKTDFRARFLVSAAVTISAKGESGMSKFAVATSTLFLQNHQVEPAGGHRE